MKKLFLMLLMATSMWAADDAVKPEDQLVTVPRRYVSADGLAKASQGSAISPYLGMGREIGEAVKGGLESVVEVSNKFADTPVGKFTLVMVAWKIMGRDLLHVALGVPIFIAGWCVWFYFIRRMYFGTWVKSLDDKGNKTRVKDPPMRFESSDGRVGMGFVMVSLIIAWNIAMLVTIMN